MDTEKENATGAVGGDEGRTQAEVGDILRAETGENVLETSHPTDQRDSADASPRISEEAKGVD